jgi:hypothetical protein
VEALEVLGSLFFSHNPEVRGDANTGESQEAAVEIRSARTLGKEMLHSCGE